MQQLICLYLLANLAYLGAKISAEFSPSGRAHYRLAFARAAKIIPVLSYIAVLLILFLNYFSPLDPPFAGLSVNLYLSRVENLFLLAVAAFLITTAGSIIAIYLTLHLSLRFAFMQNEGFFTFHPSYFLLMGFLAALAVSIDKVPFNRLRWLVRMQKRLRGALIYVIAAVTVFAVVASFQRVDLLAAWLKISSGAHLKPLTFFGTAVLIVSWYFVLVVKDHKDVILLLTTPTIMALAFGFDIDIMYTVLPLFTMLSIGVCSADDRNRENYARKRVSRRYLSY